MRVGGCLLVVCYFCLAGGAILRPYRAKYVAKAKLRAEGQVYGKSYNTSSSTSRSPATSHTRFTPTADRCCQIGERAARKKKMCNVTHLAVVRRYNYERRRKRTKKRFQRKRLGRLSEKISKCSATFPKYFTKCCDHKQKFYKHLRQCRQKPHRQRRRCRQIIKRKYT